MDGNIRLSATDQGIVSSDKRLEAALELVRSSHEEAEKFAADPQAYLKSNGVETSGLKFGEAELSDTELEQVAGGLMSTVCGSVGCVGCVSVGSD
jgi:hypothetical protein